LLPSRGKKSVIPGRRNHYLKLQYISTTFYTQIPETIRSPNDQNFKEKLLEFLNMDLKV
jgi:hypothetical protein